MFNWMRDVELEENDQILLPKALPYLYFCQTWLPCKCRLKDVKLLLSPCEFSLFPKMDLKRMKHPVYPRINHHKYCACNCQEVSNTHSHILKSINVTLGNALRARTNEYTHFTKKHRATSTGTSLGYQSKKIIREKTNIQSSVTQPHVAWLKGCGGVGVHGILQARIMEWIAIPFSKGSSTPRDRTLVSCIADRFFTIWAIGSTSQFHVGPCGKKQLLLPPGQSSLSASPHHILHLFPHLFPFSGWGLSKRKL